MNIAHIFASSNNNTVTITTIKHHDKITKSYWLEFRLFYSDD